MLLVFSPYTTSLRWKIDFNLNKYVSLCSISISFHFIHSIFAEILVVLKKKFMFSETEPVDCPKSMPLKSTYGCFDVLRSFKVCPCFWCHSCISQNYSRRTFVYKFCSLQCFVLIYSLLNHFLFCEIKLSVDFISIFRSALISTVIHECFYNNMNLIRATLSMASCVFCIKVEWRISMFHYKFIYYIRDICIIN